jgi:peptidoglycan DL-endopeptidase CwlO
MLMTRLTRRLVPLALAIAALTALILPTSAPAAPIDDKRAQAAELQAQIDANAEKLSGLNEQINDAQLALDEANETIAESDAAVDAAKARTSELRRIVAQRAASLYTRSGTEGGVEALDTANANELTTRQQYTSIAAEHDRQAVYQLKRAREDLAVRKADAEQARNVAEAKRDEMDATRAELAAGDEKLQALRNGINGEIAAIMQQAEQERIAREAAAAAERQAAASAATPATNASTGGGGASSGGGGGSYAPPPSSGDVSAVMAYAYAQLGKPYCYAGVGPGCYDCSGLTMMAWAQAGVGMPHGSNAQLAMFPRVSMSDLQVGDLVYWTDHVGIYVGGGSVLHAPRTGTVVQITGIWGGVIGANRPG